MNTKSLPQHAASRPAAPRRKDRTEFYPMRRDAMRRSNPVLLTIGTYPYLHFTWPVMRAIKIPQRKMDCEEKIVEAVRCFLVVADNLEVLQAHYLQKVLKLPSLTPSPKYCTQSNASSVKYAYPSTP